MRDLALACASALMLLLCYPKVDLAVLAWIALVPLLVALDARSPKQAFLLSCVTGFIFFSGISYWIWTVEGASLVVYLVLAAYFSLYGGAFGLATAWLCSRTALPMVAIAPSVWVALEYLRGHASFLSFPWALLGHTQYAHPALMQVAAFTGVFGLSFLIVFVNAAIAGGVKTLLRAHGAAREGGRALSRFAFPLLAGLLVCGTAGYGSFALSRSQGSAERLKLTLVQGNIRADYESGASYREATLARRDAILDRYERFTRDAAQANGASLIVWPEGAIPGDIAHEPGLRARLGRLASETRSFLLVGNSPYAKFADRKLRGKYFNGATLLSPEGTVVDNYEKVILVPFGEYNPLESVVAWPGAMAATTTNLVPGDRLTSFGMGTAVFGTTICWENMFPEHVRGLVNRGAQFIVNITNEGWYGETSVPYQLLAISAFRAVENGIWIARASNNGISAFIDPFGRITQRLRGANGKDLFIDGVLAGEISPSAGRTFYTRWGDVFALTQIGFVSLLSAYAGIFRARIFRNRSTNATGGQAP